MNKPGDMNAAKADFVPDVASSSEVTPPHWAAIRSRRRGFNLVRFDYLEGVCEPVRTGIMRIHFHYVARLYLACFVGWNTDRAIERFR